MINVRKRRRNTRKRNMTRRMKLRIKKKKRRMVTHLGEMIAYFLRENTKKTGSRRYIYGNSRGEKSSCLT
jgi:hypothetical protein